MPDDDRSLFERAKSALGFGSDERREEDETPIDVEGPPGDTSAIRTDAVGGIPGAPEASGRAGASGGMGASGAMGGAGAGGPAGATPPPSEGADATGGADPGSVRTEYEMGHEFNPDHLEVAESGPFPELARETPAEESLRVDEEATRHAEMDDEDRSDGG